MREDEELQISLDEHGLNVAHPNDGTPWYIIGFTESIFMEGHGFLLLPLNQ